MAAHVELMIIYGEVEDLLLPDSWQTELSEGGKAHERWPGIADAMLERAKTSATIEPDKP